MGDGIFIADIMEGGVAQASESLQRGDQIVAANDIGLKHANQVSFLFYMYYIRLF